MKPLYVKKNGTVNKVSGVAMPNTFPANRVGYDNTASELEATNAQDAIDEVVEIVADKVDKVAGKGLSTNDYDNTDKAKVGKIDETTTSASGNPISITGLKSNQLAKDPIITLEPIQAGTGDPSPSNVRAISGYDKIEVLSCGKNLIPNSINAIKAANNETTWNGNSCTLTGGATLTLLGDNDKLNGIKVNGTVSSQNYIMLCRPGYNTIGNTLKLGITYTATDVAVSDNITAEYSHTFTIREDWHFDNAFVYFFVNAGTYDNVIYYPQLEEGSTATTYEPYHKTTDLSLQLGQTVYGGTLDVEKGILTADRGYKTVNDLSWWYFSTGSSSLFYTDDLTDKAIGRSNVISSTYATVYEASYRILGESDTKRVIIVDNRYSDSNDFKTAMSSCQIVYELATPYTIQLTPHEISLLKDYAYVSTNGTNMSFSYKNGEMASLGDVSQLGQTVNELGDVVYTKRDRIGAIYEYTFTGGDHSYSANKRIAACGPLPKGTYIATFTTGYGLTLGAIGLRSTETGHQQPIYSKAGAGWQTCTLTGIFIIPEGGYIELYALEDCGWQNNQTPLRAIKIG